MPQTPVPLLIIDGLLFLTFIVGWLESTAISTYRLTLWRFLRAVALPLTISSFLHLITARNGWAPLFSIGFSHPKLQWLNAYLLIGPLYLLFILVPVIVILMVSVVGSQFGGINFGVPANPTETDSQPQPTDKNNSNSSP